MNHRKGCLRRRLVSNYIVCEWGGGGVIAGRGERRTHDCAIQQSRFSDKKVNDCGGRRVVIFWFKVQQADFYRCSTLCFINKVINKTWEQALQKLVNWDTQHYGGKYLICDTIPYTNLYHLYKNYLSFFVPTCKINQWINNYIKQQITISISFSLYNILK